MYEAANSVDKTIEWLSDLTKHGRSYGHIYTERKKNDSLLFGYRFLKQLLEQFYKALVGYIS